MYSYKPTKKDYAHQNGDADGKSRLGWRPEGYYKYLFEKWNRHCVNIVKELSNTIQMLRTHPKKIIKEIIYNFLAQCEWLEVCDKEKWNEIKLKNYLVKFDDDDDDNEYVYANDSLCDNLLYEFNEFYSLKLNDFKVKTMNELIELLATVNPHWILEIYAHSVLTYDFARTEPDEGWIYFDEDIVSPTNSTFFKNTVNKLVKEYC